MNSSLSGYLYIQETFILNNNNYSNNSKINKLYIQLLLYTSIQWIVYIF